MKTRLVFGGLIVVLIAFLAWFGIGGGFESVEVTTIKDFELTIYGKEFNGALGDKAASEFFDKVEANLGGKPMYVYYDGKPTKENQYSSKVIAGGLDHFEAAAKSTISFKEVLTAQHDAHYMLNKAQTNIFTAAKEEGKILDLDKMIEVYHTKNNVQVIIPVLVK